MEKKNIKDELDSLIPEKQIEGYTIRPWTLRNIKNLRKELGEIAVILKKNGMTFRNVATAFFENTEMMTDIVMDYGASLIAETIGISEEEANDLPAALIVNMIIQMVLLNMDFLKNSFGLVGMDGSMGKTSTRQ